MQNARRHQPQITRLTEERDGDSLLLESYNRALTLANKDKNEEAEAEFRRIIALDPNISAAYCNLGIVLARLGRDAEAEVEFQKSIALTPEFAPAYRGLTSSLVAQKRFKEAESSCLLNIRLQEDVKNKAEAYLMLSIILDKQNLLDKAIDAARIATEICPTHPDAQLYLQKFVYKKRRNLNYLLGKLGNKIKNKAFNLILPQKEHSAAVFSPDMGELSKENIVQEAISLGLSPERSSQFVEVLPSVIRALNREIDVPALLDAANSSTSNERVTVADQVKINPEKSPPSFTRPASLATKRVTKRVKTSERVFTEELVSEARSIVNAFDSRKKLDDFTLSEDEIAAVREARAYVRAWDRIKRTPRAKTL